MKIFAHRGSSLIWPENTMLAFDNADNAGATGFETDLRLSKDGEIVLSHDDNLGRFGQADKTISELTEEEITAIEICSIDGQFKDKLISLKTLLQKYPEKDYIFDCKFSGQLLFVRLKELLSEIKFHDRFWFLNWSGKGGKHVRNYFPQQASFPRVARTGIWGGLSIFGLGHLSEPKNSILALPVYFNRFPVFSGRQIASIARRKKTFVGYLVNSEKEFRQCETKAVEIVLTDRPDLITKLL